MNRPSGTASLRNGGVTEVPIELVRGGTVKSRVLDASGDPVPGASVGVQLMGPGALSRIETESNADGYYELRGITPGEASLQVADSQWSRILRGKVQVASRQVTASNPVLPDPTVFRGRLLSGSGARSHPVQTINNAVIPDEARDLGDIRLR